MKSFLSWQILLVVVMLAACQPATRTVEETDVAGYTTTYTIDSETQRKNGPAWVRDSLGTLLEEMTYIDDQLNGLRVIYDEAGDTSTVETYVEGRFEGPYRNYHPGGKQVKMSGKYVDNTMTGRWLKYYPNGQLQEVVTFANNEENGPFREWFEDGTLAAEGSYRNGDNEHGRLRIYNTDGSLNRVMDCETGICKSIWRDTFPTPAPARELPDFE